jgi:precorrin-6B methylase 2
MDYNRVAKYFKPFIPSKLRSIIRKNHQQYIFKKSLRQFENRIDDIEDNKKLIAKLIYGWGNLGYSAMHDYLYEVLINTRDKGSIILECGSGLSTILMGIIAKNKNINIIALEHQENWANKVQRVLDEHDIKSVNLIICPIKSYNDFDWYDLDIKEIPNKISLVICDGPPAQTRGGRYGMLPIIHSKLSKTARILMDDYTRDSEKKVVERWSKIYSFNTVEKGRTDLFAILDLL